MISISGFTGDRNVTVSLSGSASVNAFSGVNVFTFERSSGASQTITFDPTENFGALSLSSTTETYEIEKIELTSNSFTFITKNLITAPMDAILTLPGSNTNVPLLLNQDISGLGLGIFDLEKSPEVPGTQSLHITELTGNPPGVVPEPSSLAIFGIGALGMAGLGMRRRRSEEASV